MSEFAVVPTHVSVKNVIYRLNDILNFYHEDDRTIEEMIEEINTYMTPAILNCGYIDDFLSKCSHTTSFLVKWFKWTCKKDIIDIDILHYAAQLLSFVDEENKFPHSSIKHKLNNYLGSKNTEEVHAKMIATFDKIMENRPTFIRAMLVKIGNTEKKITFGVQDEKYVSAIYDEFKEDAIWKFMAQMMVTFGKTDKKSEKTCYVAEEKNYAFDFIRYVQTIYERKGEQLSFSPYMSVDQYKMYFLSTNKNIMNMHFREVEKYTPIIDFSEYLRDIVTNKDMVEAHLKKVFKETDDDVLQKLCSYLITFINFRTFTSICLLQKINKLNLHPTVYANLDVFVNEFKHPHDDDYEESDAESVATSDFPAESECSELSMGSERSIGSVKRSAKNRHNLEMIKINADDDTENAKKSAKNKRDVSDTESVKSAASSNSGRNSVTFSEHEDDAEDEE